MKTFSRIKRHLRLINAGRKRAEQDTPPFLILFINSICNQACDHCFYWQNLNQRDDLTTDEIKALSRSLGPIENLYLSGGEPFLQPDYGEICAEFVKNNGTKRIYCPTNASFTDRIEKQARLVLAAEGLEEFTIELSLDGMPEFHDAFRNSKNAFEKAMATYEMLAELQKEHPKLQIHANSVATGENVDEIKRLTTFLFERCPKIAHHNIAMLRGERKRPTLEGPQLVAYRELVDYVAALWSEREEGRFGGCVEPMLHWGKERIAKQQAQAIPCKAGILVGVVYANGDVSVCEQHEPIGNLRQADFPTIWNAEPTRALRKSIGCKECFCTNEVFLWPSIVFSPTWLPRAFLGARAWRSAPSLPASERVDPHADTKP